jgi:hypothetical protein
MPTVHLTLAEENHVLRKQFEELSAAATTLVAPLSDEQFAWRPDENTWSVAHCLEHLNATARLYLPRLDEGVAESIRMGLYGDGPFHYNWIGRLFVRLTEPPARLRMKAPATFQPGVPRSRQEVLAAFRAYQVQYVDRLHQANGLDLARARVSSPVNRWIKMPLGSGFLLMAAHERRHLDQARRLIARPDFPK